MAHHSGARSAMVLVVLGAFASGCSTTDDLGSDSSDVVAATHVWTDPWVAPTDATIAGPGFGSNGFVSRTVGIRNTTYEAPVRAVAAGELALALEAGWMPTSSACDETVVIALAAGGGSSATALLTVAPEDRSTVARVEAYTPHHLDTDRTQPAPVEQTCLDTGVDDLVPPVADSVPERSDDPPDTGSPSWKRGAPSADERDVLDRLAADPALSRLGAKVFVSDLSTGNNRRSAYGTEITTSATTLDELVGQLPGWDLTYAACGGGGPVRATFLGTDLDVVLAATIDDDGAAVAVTTPIVEGPVPTWLDDIVPLDESRCLDGTRDALVADGTPAVLPTSLTPIAS